MPNLGAHRPQRSLFALQLLRQKFLPLAQLPIKYSRASLPRQGDPCEKRRPLSLIRPFLALQRICQRRTARGRCAKHTALRSGHRLIAVSTSDQPKPCQFLQRVIHLRTRDTRPVAYLPPLQFQVRLIPMHRAFRQQAEQHQVRCRKLALPSPGHPAPFASGSNTTIRTSSPEGADCAPAPRPHEKHPGNTDPASAR